MCVVYIKTSFWLDVRYPQTSSYSTGITITTEKIWTVFIFFLLTQTLTRHTYLNTKPYALLISFLSVFDM